MSQSLPYQLFPEITPYHHDWLTVGATHRMYFEQCGNPNGAPVVFLHGGPGSGCNPTQRRFFDPAELAAGVNEARLGLPSQRQG